MKIKTDYKHTLYACYLGYITQAIVNNLAPLLFLTFQKTYQISLDKIALLVSINFGVQLIVDFLAARYVDRIGYRISIVAAHFFAAAGLIGLGLFPPLFSNPYWGFILAITLYAIGGGIIEVLVSPIVEACPTDQKESAMSLLHSFYSWGHVFVVICSTLFFATIGIENWSVLVCLWAIIPFFNALYFLFVPIQRLVTAEEGQSIKSLCKTKIFWCLVILMICSGASEQAMSQWASTFAEAGLQVSKMIGDLAGPCFFAICMGCARVFYAKYSEKIELQRFMIGSGILCICGYLIASFSPFAVFSLLGCGICGVSVGVLWPGTFSIASKSCKTGGTALFALLALAGDLGCAAGPGIVGVVSGAFSDNLKIGLLAATVFPILLIFGILYCRKLTGKMKE